MPFKSEKQRKYLWANEPEIARDWTDTYGSKIHKADGGRIGFFKGAQADTAEGKSMSPGTSSSGGSRHSGPSRGDHHPPAPSAPSLPPQLGGPSTVQDAINLQNTGTRGDGILQNFQRKGIEHHLDRNQFRQMQNLGLINNPGKWSILAQLLQGSTGEVPEWAEDWSADDLIALTGTGPYAGATNAPNAKQLERAADRLTTTMDFRETLDEPNLQTRFDETFPGPDPGTGGEGQPWLWPPYGMASAPEEEVVEDEVVDFGEGNYRVPEQYRLAAEGGRIPAAFGGIMDTYTGRRKYGFGSIFKKIGKAAKKVIKSPLGKAALLGGIGYLATPGSGVGLSKWLKPAGKGAWWKKALMGDTWNPGTKGQLAKGLLKNPWVTIPAAGAAAGLYTAMKPPEELESATGEWDEDKEWWDNYLASLGQDNYRVPTEYRRAEGGRIGRQEGGLMNLGGMEKDYRNDGGFVPLGGEEKADDVPARLSRNEFVFTADAVRNAGGGDIDRGAEVMENVMKNLEAGGKVSEESQGQGAQEMFETSERLSEVV